MKMSFLRVLIVCALGAIASTTQAGLTHVNDDTFDALVSQANEITRDSATNLDWLDVDAYIGHNWVGINQKFNTVGHLLYDGWRHATQAEVGVYFGNLGLSITGYPGLTVNFDGGASGDIAEAYTGHTATGGPGENNFARGYTADPASGNLVFVAMYFFSDRSHNGGDETYLNYVGYAELGHWLVRTSPSEVVPEPSTFSMLAFGCIAMAGYTRLRRRRK